VKKSLRKAVITLLKGTIATASSVYIDETPDKAIDGNYDTE
jgi:hypothetical protein